MEVAVGVAWWWAEQRPYMYSAHNSRCHCRALLPGPLGAGLYSPYVVAALPSSGLAPIGQSLMMYLNSSKEIFPSLSLSPSRIISRASSIEMISPTDRCAKKTNQSLQS